MDFCLGMRMEIGETNEMEKQVDSLFFDLLKMETKKQQLSDFI